MFGQNVDEHNPAPSPSGHPLLSGPPTLNDIHQIFTQCLHSLLPALVLDLPSLKHASCGGNPCSLRWLAWLTWRFLAH
jgi:hypothetical protein